jgi:hypothetical protein
VLPEILSRVIGHERRQLENNTLMRFGVKINERDPRGWKNSLQGADHAAIEQHENIAVTRVPQGANSLKHSRQIHPNPTKIP